MSQHFLLSAKARTLSLASVLRMTDVEAETTFRNLRWPAGKPICPHCECPTVYECRRPSGALRFRCKACRGDFSIASGTLFAHHKMPLQTYLAAIAIFCNEVKGKSALALSRDLGTQYKTAWVLAHKLREAMASELKGRTIGGAGKVAEIDGGYFGGYIKPANHKENRRDRRLAKNQNGKRQCVVIIRERDGKTLPAVFRTESEALGFIRNRVAPGTELMADESRAWNDLHGRYAVKRINHQEAYSLAGACTNGAEEFFSRMRRAEIGHHHHIAGAYLNHAPVFNVVLHRPAAARPGRGRDVQIARQFAGGDSVTPGMATLRHPGSIAQTGPARNGLSLRQNTRGGMSCPPSEKRTPPFVFQSKALGAYPPGRWRAVKAEAAQRWRGTRQP